MREFTATLKARELVQDTRRRPPETCRRVPRLGMTDVLPTEVWLRGKTTQLIFRFPGCEPRVGRESGGD